MIKVKAFAFILVGTLIHLGLMIGVIGGRLACGVQPNCVSLGNKIAGLILEFPLGSAVRVLHFVGFDLQDDHSVFWFFAPYIGNSLVAVTLIWFLVIKPFVRWRKKARERPCTT